jgi:uncharacterized protein (DUF2267 family)
MDYEEIIDAARQEAGGVSHEVAERAVQETLQTLNERLPRGEARRIPREPPGVDDHASRKSHRNAQVGLCCLITEFIVDGSREVLPRRWLALPSACFAACG